MTWDELDMEERAHVDEQTKKYAREHGLDEENEEVYQEHMRLFAEAAERQRKKLMAARRKEFLDNPDAFMENVRACVESVTKEEYLSVRDGIYSLVKIGELPKSAKMSFTKGARGIANYIFARLNEQEYKRVLIDAGREDELRDMVGKYALSIFPKKKNEYDKKKGEDAKEKKKDIESATAYFYMDNSQSIQIVKSIFAGQGDIHKTINGINKRSNSQKAKFLPSANPIDRPREMGIRIEKDGKYSYSVIFENIDNLLQNYNVSGKLFDFFMKEAIARNCIVNGKLANGVVEIPLEEFVKWELYTDVRAAREAVERAKGTLQHIAMEGWRQRGKQRTATRRAILLPTIGIERGACRVRLNPDVTWEALLEYTMVYPPYYFSLPVKAYNMLGYLLSLTRQNTKQVIENGCFTVSVSTIASYLGLPEIGETKDSRRDIILPINKAVGDIQNAENIWRKKNPDKDYILDVELDCIEETARSFLEGKIKITPHGELLKMCQEVRECNRKAIETAEKRKQTWLDKTKQKMLISQVMKRAEQMARETMK